MSANAFFFFSSVEQLLELSGFTYSKNDDQTFSVIALDDNNKIVPVAQFGAETPAKLFTEMCERLN